MDPVPPGDTGLVTLPSSMIRMRIPATLATQRVDEQGDLEDVRIWAVPRPTPLIGRLLYTLGAPILLFTVIWLKKLVFRRRTQ
jgi:hypothetical protein